MPKEVIATCENEQLVVSWTKADSLDPMIAVGSWKAWEDPNGAIGGWEPAGPQWAIDYETAGRMAEVLQRAKRQVYRTAESTDANNITIHVHGSVFEPKELAKVVQQEILKLGMRNLASGGSVGSDND